MHALRDMVEGLTQTVSDIRSIAGEVDAASQIHLDGSISDLEGCLFAGCFGRGSFFIDGTDGQ